MTSGGQNVSEWVADRAHDHTLLESPLAQHGRILAGVHRRRPHRAFAASTGDDAVVGQRPQAGTEPVADLRRPFDQAFPTR